jgi:transcriptional regulator with XRE-family HTH domain
MASSFANQSYSVRTMEPEPKLGPVGQQVAANVKASRGRRGMSVRDLSRRLTELGRPILPSGITKIEQGARRVDVDDLNALAAALGVSPTRLLLHGSEDEAEFEAEFQNYVHARRGTGKAALHPMTYAVFDAVFKEGVDAVVVQDKLERLARMLPALGELAEENVGGGLSHGRSQPPPAPPGAAVADPAERMFPDIGEPLEIIEAPDPTRLTTSLTHHDDAGADIGEPVKIEETPDPQREEETH